MPSVTENLSDPALRVDDLSFHSGYTTVLKKIGFELLPGELLLLIGPNGAGKSTLLKCLAGLLHHQGTSKISGGTLKKNYNLRRKIGYLGHESFLYSKFSARENLVFYANLYGSSVNVDSVLADYDLAEFGDQLVESYSRGMKQKLALARSLLHEPEVILLDEPFTGLDQDASVMLREKIRDLKTNNAIVLTTHELEQGFELCDKLLILKGGRQIFFGTKDEIEGDIRQFYTAMTL